MRSLGYIPHAFAAVKRWPIAPMAVGGDPRRPLNQLLEADIVYVRDFSRPDSMDDDQLKHLSLIAHHCYRSFDLTVKCLLILEQRGCVAKSSASSYMKMLNQ
jgi:hypothetical protein